MTLTSYIAIAVLFDLAITVREIKRNLSASNIRQLSQSGGLIITQTERTTILSAMERIASTSLRASVRVAATRAQTGKRSIANSNLYNYATSRYATSKQNRSQLCSASFNLNHNTSRLYSSESSSQSSPLGTISSGAAGISPSSSDHTLTRLLAPEHLDENEKEIFDKINAELQPTKLDVKDISGGCGSMYGIEVESEKFRGLSMLKQQRLVNAVVKEKMDREGWHGVQLRTKIPGK